MNSIENYYYVIIGIGLFIMFALVGYLVEISKKYKEFEKEQEKTNNEINEELKDVTINSVLENKEELLIDSDILNKKEWKKYDVCNDMEYDYKNIWYMFSMDNVLFHI